MSSVAPQKQQPYVPKDSPNKEATHGELAGAGVASPALEVVDQGQEHTHQAATEHGDRVYIEPATGPRANVPQVYAAIAKALQVIGQRGVGKSGTNQDQGYKFRSIDDVYGAVNAGLSAAGLVILPSVITRELVEHRTASGKANWRVTLKMMYTFVCVADGSSHEVGPFYGEAFDTSDKATNKALTVSYKYMLIEVFCIPLVGIDDADDHTPEVDAGTAVHKKPAGKQEATREREPIEQDPELITAEQVKHIEARLTETGIKLESFLAKAGGLESLAELSKASLEPALGWITRQDQLNKAAAIANRKATEPAKLPEQPAAAAPGSTQPEQAPATAPAPADGPQYTLELAGGKELGKHRFAATPSVGGVIPFAGVDFKIIELRGIDTEKPFAVLEYVKKPEKAADPAPAETADKPADKPATAKDYKAAKGKA